MNTTTLHSLRALVEPELPPRTCLRRDKCANAPLGGSLALADRVTGLAGQQLRWLVREKRER